MARTVGDHVIQDKLDVGDNARFHAGLQSPYLEVVDQKDSGSGGGTFTAGTSAVAGWRTRDLTSTIVNDFATSITLAAAAGDGGQIVLPAGVYFVDASCPAFDVDEHVARLADVTDGAGQLGATVVLGTAELSDTTSPTQSRSQIVGRFTLSRSTTLEIQHRCAITRSVNGFGVDAGFYETDNLFTTVRMWQIRDDS